MPRSRTAPALARRYLADACATCPPDVLDITLLLASEIVTNAVRHAHGPVTLQVTRSASEVLVTVEDDSPQRLEPHTARPFDEGDRGLQIVDALATQWGTSPHPTGPGKRVWFEVHIR